MNDDWKLVPSVWLCVGDIINFMYDREWFIGVILIKGDLTMKILCLGSKIVDYPVCGLEKNVEIC